MQVTVPTIIRPRADGVHCRKDCVLGCYESCYLGGRKRERSYDRPGTSRGAWACTAFCRAAQAKAREALEAPGG